MASQPPSAGDTHELGRLRWRCRRGMKELDVLLVRYLDEHFGAASPADQEAFRQLLGTEDAVLYAYCLGSEPPPPRFRALIARVTSHPAAHPTAHPAAEGNAPDRR